MSSFGVESISATALPSLSSAELISAQLRIGPATTAVTVKVISTAVLCWLLTKQLACLMWQDQHYLSNQHRLALIRMEYNR
ncbi:MAG: hypothetical protein IPI59_08460 [Sphingobacteriales bacterium]|nr:hypothetical protein [Sphingobacteriales bacterium]